MPTPVDRALPYLSPWLRLQLLIRQICSTTSDDATWPTMKQTLNEALKMQSTMRRRRGPRN
jgi:hypothetical protein